MRDVEFAVLFVPPSFANYLNSLHHISLIGSMFIKFLPPLFAYRRGKPGKKEILIYVKAQCAIDSLIFLLLLLFIM